MQKSHDIPTEKAIAISPGKPRYPAGLRGISGTRYGNGHGRSHRAAEGQTTHQKPATVTHKTGLFTVQTGTLWEGAHGVTLFEAGR